VSVTSPQPPIEGWEVLDLLTSLVQKSLVFYSEDDEGRGRYRLLETVRQYARDRLMEAGEGEAVRTRHLEFFLNWVEQGPGDERLETEHDNLRAALAWSKAQGQWEVGLPLGGALGMFWQLRGYMGEGREHLAGLLALPGAEARTAVRAWALCCAGWLAHFQGDSGAAWALFEESLAIFREQGDKGGIRGSLIGLGGAARAQGDYGAARALLEESLAICRGQGDKGDIAQSLGQLGWVAHAQGDYGAARALFEESLAIFRELGSKQGIAWLINGLGMTAHGQGDSGAARAFFEESLAIFREQGNKRGIVVGLEGLAAVAVAQGEPEHAARLFGSAEGLREAIGAGMPPAERAEHDRSVAAARTALGQEAFAAAWAEGRAMPLDEAVALALEEARSD
jgi:tetratricopeptide (TPR) repeat protein